MDDKEKLKHRAEHNHKIGQQMNEVSELWKAGLVTTGELREKQTDLLSRLIVAGPGEVDEATGMRMPG